RARGFGRGAGPPAGGAPAGPGTVVAAPPVAPVVDGPAAVEEADRLRSYLGGLPGPAPVVVGGDFNATWDHVRFRSLRGLGYTDSVSGGGDGWVPTWPADRRVPPPPSIHHTPAGGGAPGGGTPTPRRRAPHRPGLSATVRLPADRGR
ncbi:endonuclease/exonuclease/phosphatase family protein, partial [uncultured Dietzia sp.]|uniref:endonuclease/exonuclease/phosphatase family protein n=1 Tax=uncultured Dietzia sp. TaxID=395519 RepID=UPI00345B7A23